MMLQDHEYDLVFVGHDMPTMTGLGMLVRLRHYEVGMAASNPQPFVLFVPDTLDRKELSYHTIKTLSPAIIRAKARELGAVVQPKTCHFSLLIDLAVQASLGRDAWDEILSQEPDTGSDESTVLEAVSSCGDQSKRSNDEHISVVG